MTGEMRRKKERTGEKFDEFDNVNATERFSVRQLKFCNAIVRETV